MTHIDDPEVEAAYQADHAEARTAAGSPTELLGKVAQTDGTVRYTAPSLVVEFNGTRLEAGGFQPVGAYDVIVANANPSLERTPPPETAAPLFDRFPEGLTTQEVAALMTHGNDNPDPAGCEHELLELAAAGAIERISLGDSALWVTQAA